MPTPPTIGPTPRWVSGELRFYKPTAGINPLTGGTYAVLSAAQASGPYTVDVSSLWDLVTWRPADDVGQYVTAADLGLLTVSQTKWYRDRITDSVGLSAEGASAVYGGDTANALCVVSFSGLTEGATVSCRLSGPVQVQGQTYAVGPYSTTVVSGTASLALPRCDAGVAADGSTGLVFGYFAGGDPEAFVLPRRIPDSATATFASLIPPGESQDPLASGVVRYGEGPPTSDIGSVGDYYLDTLTGDLYQLVN